MNADSNHRLKEDLAMRKHTWGRMVPTAGVAALGLALGLALVAPTLLRASTKDDDIARLQAATTVFHEVMATPDKAIPQEILEGAQCIAIIPGVKKAALGIGGDYGKGIVTCRQGSKTGPWGPPLFVTIGGGSWGFQIGVQSSDVIMVFPNRNQLDSLLSSKFRIGAEAAAAAGPVGRHVAAATDARLNSEILTYGRSKGAFAGISISGAVVQPDSDGNAAMYGENISPKNILSANGARVPPSAHPLIRALALQPSTAPAPPH
jgi:lipid-binding SYLF domain-containing protein